MNKNIIEDVNARQYFSNGNEQVINNKDYPVPDVA